MLDDDVWRGRPLDTGDWLTYNPLHGEAIKQQTKVWMAYDTSFIYFDSSRYQVLTDFLASYELRPGTVVYLG